MWFCPECGASYPKPTECTECGYDGSRKRRSRKSQDEMTDEEVGAFVDALQKLCESIAEREGIDIHSLDDGKPARIMRFSTVKKRLGTYLKKKGVAYEDGEVFTVYSQEEHIPRVQVRLVDFVVDMVYAEVTIGCIETDDAERLDAYLDALVMEEPDLEYEEEALGENRHQIVGTLNFSYSGPAQLLIDIRFLSACADDCARIGIDMFGDAFHATT